MRRALYLTLTVVLCACTHEQQTEKPVVDVSAVKAAVTKVVSAQYAAMGRGDVDSWGAAFADDVFYFGPFAADAVEGKQAALAAVHGADAPLIQGGGTVVRKPGKLRMDISRDGKAAWVANELELRAKGPGQATSIPLRMTELLANVDGRWKIVAAHWSRPVADEEAFEMVAGKQLPPLAEIEDFVGAGAEQAAGTLERVMAGPLSEVPKFVARNFYGYGSDPREKLTKQRYGAALAEMGKQGVTIDQPLGMRTFLAPGGQVAFVALNSLFKVKTPDGDLGLPLRQSVVLQRTGESWEISQLHASVGLPATSRL